MPSRILVIQTAFLGDAILATALLENLHQAFPDAQLDFLVRKGHEGLFTKHPFLNQVLVWDKKKDRYRGLWKLLLFIRKQRYEHVITVQRFASTGFLTAFSGAKNRIGFDKNPLSFAFTATATHDLESGLHETSRNHSLIEFLVQTPVLRPRLYPTPADFEKIKGFQQQPYICVAPASVWFTKQYPADKWAAWLRSVPDSVAIYILGSPDDKTLGEDILKKAHRTGRSENLCGRLSFLESAALMKTAQMNFVNDSAPMHMASALNAPVCAVYCSTIPDFGFGPLSENSRVLEITDSLPCRPCGLHGHRACPEGHFRCAVEIKESQFLDVLRESLARE
ncbi:glycosyltransferase family 9 protein [Arundinibacter roseus]|uniref:Glycosyltransferase family 9 protein n=2 Tax=Arundinibacter roseus TaxID=2070510 RepID=A0A4R4KMM8_9BACT|nr:glycosyltransferase family 9 protein [Arundinibacter roseus]